MQSVVTGQAPITLECKITSGGKQIKQKIIHTTIKTNHTPQTKNEKVKSLLLYYNAVFLWRDFVTTELVCISLGGRIGTESGCAGCRRVARPF